MFPQREDEHHIDLARVTLSPRARRRQSLMDVSVEGEEMEDSRASQHRRPRRVSKNRVRQSSSNFQWGRDL